ncbi:MAG: 5'/3'-nucleotidase SurE [Acidobacteriota bacterium]
MSKSEMLILLTNDDGVDSQGLLELRSVLAGLGRVVTVAPSEERSAVSHGLTLHQPIRILSLAPDYYALTGTPADCVIFALRKILTRLPDLVVSGINHGPNLGDDILYSGTVAAAREAALYRLPAVAVSSVNPKPENLPPAANFVRRLLADLYPDRIPAGTFLNVNVPEGDPQQYRFTRQGSKRVASAVEEKEDPRGRTYYWIGLDQSEWEVDVDTDYEAIQEGIVSVTPLQRDQTCYRTLQSYRRERAKIGISE